MILSSHWFKGPKKLLFSYDLKGISELIDLCQLAHGWTISVYLFIYFVPFFERFSEFQFEY